MKLKVLLYLVFISTAVFSQTPRDQSIFKNKIWNVVVVNENEQSFFDSTGTYLGSKFEDSKAVVYKDKWQRTIRRYNKETVKQPVAVKKKPSKKVKSPKGNNRRANQTIVRRNKATFYDGNGVVVRTARRRRSKVYFHDSKGGLIGYKIYNSDGSKTYKDPQGRTTGVSHIDKTGRIIYSQENRGRQTPSVLFEDPFLFR